MPGPPAVRHLGATGRRAGGGRVADRDRAFCLREVGFWAWGPVLVVPLSSLTLARLRAAGLVESGPLGGGQAPWVWLTAKGARTSGQGFCAWRMRPGLVAHTAAVNEVRLHIAARAPEGLWVCERQLARELSRSQHLPDAMFCIDGQRHAIEVELTPKARARTEAIVSELSARHDVVVYFCAPPAKRQLDDLAQTGAFPNLAVRDLPTGPMA